ncbi:unnamed protein product [Schistosoma rodhaini]|uniref:Uncharacterized protein n=1 Tax=Schistosoma rodhaini TaxID=6188 RepID=A0AA85G9E4_9TREM|nr:unnamed protein product [Schistosoma rodhaini]
MISFPLVTISTFLEKQERQEEENVFKEEVPDHRNVVHISGIAVFRSQYPTSQNRSCHSNILFKRGNPCLLLHAYH